ncbi:MAG: hypothetical protein Gyms2KO_34340 [Gymnodinialimonas sp.]
MADHRGVVNAQCLCRARHGTDFGDLKGGAHFIPIIHRLSVRSLTNLRLVVTMRAGGRKSNGSAFCAFTRINPAGSQIV